MLAKRLVAILLVGLNFSILSAEAETQKFGFNYKPISQKTVPKREYTQLPNMNEKGDCLSIVLQGENSGPYTCTLVLTQKNGNARNLAVWPAGDSYCEGAHTFFLPGGNVLDLHFEKDNLFKGREIQTDGKVLSEFSLDNLIEPYMDQFDIRMNSKGQVAAFFNEDEFEKGKNSTLVVYNNGAFKSFSYKKSYRLEKLSGWGEILAGYEFKSVIINALNGKIMAKFPFSAIDFNHRHEAVSYTHAKTRSGYGEINDCNFPNSSRLESFNFEAIGRNGELFGSAINMESGIYQYFKFIPSKTAHRNREFCLDLKVEVIGACSKLFTSYDGVIEPLNYEVEIPETLSCSIRTSVKDYNGRPIAGVNAVMIERSHPEVASVIQKTNERGQAVLNFVLNKDKPSYSIVSPYLDKKYRASADYIRNYIDPGV